MSDVINFQQAKYIKDKVEASQVSYTELAKVVVTKTMELSDFVSAEVRNDHMILSDDAYLGSPKIITASLLIRAACDELLRLADDDPSSLRISHSEAKQLGIELFAQYYDETLACQKEIIQNGVNQLFAMLQESSLTKAVEKKEQEFKADCRRVNEELEKKNDDRS